jgi:hypothetical protein
MAGVFDLKLGAFDSSEVSILNEAYDIAMHGLEASHTVNAQVANRLARSIVKVARTEADCLRHDGTLDPVRLAQRAVLRMLQINAARLERVEEPAPSPRQKLKLKKEPTTLDTPAKSESAASIILKIFDRTSFAKL